MSVVVIVPLPAARGALVRKAGPQVEAQVSSSRSAWLAFMRQMVTQRVERFCGHRWWLIQARDPDTYPAGSMTYDLRRLRLHSLIERVPHSLYFANT